MDISLKDQTVKVDVTTATYEEVETAIKKTGKTIKSGKVVAPESGKVVAAETPAVVA